MFEIIGDNSNSETSLKGSTQFYRWVTCYLLILGLIFRLSQCKLLTHRRRLHGRRFVPDIE